jgi:fructokinase
LPILAAGEILWDVFEHRELLGGAPLNFAITTQRLGEPVALLTAVGNDAPGARALASIQTLGLSCDLIQQVEGVPTGSAVVTTDEAGNASFVIHRPAAFDRLAVDAQLLSRIQGLNPSWMYFGTLAQTEPQNEANLREILARVPEIRCFYDMNLREGHWHLALVERLSGLSNVLKLNETEAHLLHAATDEQAEFSLEGFCRKWSHRYDIEIICVTLGSQGCAIFADGELQTVSGFSVEVVDTVGAGDAFAAAFLHGLQQGWPAKKRAQFANAVGAMVASHAGAIADWDISQAWDLVASNGSELG